MRNNSAHINSNYILSDLFGLCDKTILVTGCASGIGQSFCNYLSQAGADIVGGYNKTDYSETQKIVEENGAKFYPVFMDLACDNNFESILKIITDDFKPIDMLINNAGVNLRNYVLKYSKENWYKTIQINLNSTFLICKAFASYLIKNNRKGKIINVLSLLAFQAGCRTSAYTASKHGVLGLSKLLGNELGQYGITVNAIAPGYIRTNMTNDFINNVQISDAFLKRISVGRWGEVDDLAGTIIFLASRASDYINGETVIVDGGYLNS